MLQDNHLHWDDVELFGFGVTDFLEGASVAVGIAAVLFVIFKVMDQHLAFKGLREWPALSAALLMPRDNQDIFFMIVIGIRLRGFNRLFRFVKKATLPRMDDVGLAAVFLTEEIFYFLLEPRNLCFELLGLGAKREVCRIEYLISFVDLQDQCL